MLDKVSTDINHDRFSEFAKIIRSREAQLARYLRSIESQQVVDDEIAKSTDALLRSRHEVDLFKTRVPSLASILPLNLPLYSLVLFGIIPTGIARNIFVRPPTALHSVFKELIDVLELELYFPQLHVFFGNKDAFVESYISTSDVVLFTGKPENAEKLQKSIRPDTLFLFSGRGVNPVVIEKDADLDAAVSSVTYLKTFNSGQDCAAPDCILVHSSVIDLFQEKLSRRLQDIKVGHYDNIDNVVGPLIESEKLNQISQYLNDNRYNIKYGGGVDFHNKIVSPTIIRSNSLDRANFDELFAPIFCLSPFDDDDQLISYFSSDRYISNAMYVTLFGSSKYISAQKHSVLIRETTIHDIERGNDEYGGWSKGASYIRRHGVIRPKPLLISREIGQAADWEKLWGTAPGSQYINIDDGMFFEAWGSLAGPHLFVDSPTAMAESSSSMALNRLIRDIEARRVRIDVGSISIRDNRPLRSAFKSVETTAKYKVKTKLTRETADRLDNFGFFFHVVQNTMKPVVRFEQLDCEARIPFIDVGIVSTEIADQHTHENYVAAGFPKLSGLAELLVGPRNCYDTMSICYDVTLNVMRNLGMIGGSVRKVYVPDSGENDGFSSF